MSLILALEFDPERGRTLKRLVGEWMDAEVVVAPSTDEAIAFMQQHGPDLILMSTLTPPGDESSLTEFLRQRPADRHVPALTVPPLIDPENKALQEERQRGLLSLFGARRKPSLWQSYDQQALSTRLRHALEASCSAVYTSAGNIGSDAAPVAYDLALENLLQDFDRSHGQHRESYDYGAVERDGAVSMRPRARRWNSKDLSWLTQVQLPWGLRVDLLNISSSGVLVESAARFVEGSATVFQLSGPDRNLFVPARVIRSKVANSGSRGVKYQAAAIFDEAVLEAELLRPAAAMNSNQLEPEH